MAWEAFEDAGQGRENLFGRPVGVFIGIGNADYARLMHDSARSDSIDLYSTTGNVFSTAAGRLSYTLGLQGPSMALDTACSSSLVAIHLACQSLRADESVMALAGGVNLILAPETMIAMSRVPGGLAPDGRCRAFDAAANGLGRGEGCGLVVLKRLSDALRDRDPVVALIRGSAVNQDGRSAGLTAPSAQAQAALIRKALSSSRVSPEEVTYLETHGPGTALGDPIEAGALGVVFGDASSRARPLVVGSVKTNIGHLESAAGVAGFIKTALIVKNGEIPPNLHFKTPNPNIPWDRLPITVPTERTPLDPGSRSRIAAVSAFGVSGTNAHAVLEEPPPSPLRIEPGSRQGGTPTCILTLSARTEPALRQLLERYQDHLERHPALELNDVCYTGSVGRFHFPHRFVALASSRDHLREQLQAGRAGNPSRGAVRGTASNSPNIGLFFSDIDSVDSHVRDQLSERFPVFRIALEECARGPAAFGFAYALAALVRSWGVVPSVVMGHGIGEIVASCAAGAVSVEAGLALSMAWSARGESHLGTVVSEIEFSEPTTPMLSQFTAHRVSDELAAPRYWSGALETTPRSFDESIQQEQVDLLLEIGASASSPENAKPVRRQRLSDLPSALESLAILYVTGVPLHWESYYDDLACRRVHLPTYPFQRERHWFEKKDPLPKPAADTERDPLSGQLYEEKWRIQPTTGLAAPDPSTIGTWLILADDTGIGDRLSHRLQGTGNGCFVLAPGESYEEVDDRTLHLRPESPADFERLFSHWSERGLGPVKGIVHLWGIEELDGEPSLPELQSSLRTLCGSTLHLVQSLMKARPEVLPRVWVVTRGAVQVDEQDVVRPAQHALWGMARVLAHEHPELGWTRIDLDPTKEAADDAGLASEIFRASDGEKEVAFRGSERFVSRLSRSSESSVGKNPHITLRSDATYLISGGLGGLGRRVARWMTDRGARHIVVLGRSTPPPAVEAHFQALRQSGTAVDILQADVSDRSQLQALLSRIDTKLPLRGIVHCAGVLDDGVVINQTWDRFERVLAPKVDGAWNLHDLTRNADLDFFVLFSSASAVFGNPGQANYATANAFLDGLARLRRARGMPGLSINWGIWSDVGGVAEKRLDEVINAAGVGVILPDEGLRALEHLLARSSPQVAMIPIDWPAFLSRTGTWSFLEEFRPASGNGAESPPPFLEELSRTPLGERRSLLHGHIRSHVAHVLRTDISAFGAKQGFFEMGMDSLTALELKNRVQTGLGCTLPSTVAMECPNIEALVDYLATNPLASLFPSEEAPAEAPADTLEQDLSEEEIHRLVDEKLKNIETLLGK